MSWAQFADCQEGTEKISELLPQTSHKKNNGRRRLAIHQKCIDRLRGGNDQFPVQFDDPGRFRAKEIIQTVNADSQSGNITVNTFYPGDALW